MVSNVSLRYKLKLTIFSHLFVVLPSPRPTSGLLISTGLGVHVGIGSANRSLESKMRVELVNFVFYIGVLVLEE